MIYVVGSNPTPKTGQVPFSGTRSGTVLKSWLREVGVLPNGQVTIINASLEITSGGKAPKITSSDVKRIQTSIPEGSKVIALGTVAHKALMKAKRDCFVLPHPSGCNRKLNDSAYVRQVLKNCKEWLEKPKVSSEPPDTC